ncbi:hypothetical protein NicSoilB8_20210 [Arthrobacter sp. NicSoilB8]|nr:hypothetical protein NicSoilB8_20210 [Arthrobacter sp. NicSoilB8]
MGLLSEAARVIPTLGQSRTRPRGGDKEDEPEDDDAVGLGRGNQRQYVTHGISVALRGAEPPEPKGRAICRWPSPFNPFMDRHRKMA